jgi:hypothetical protein
VLIIQKEKYMIAIKEENSDIKEPEYKMFTSSSIGLQKLKIKSTNPLK